MNLNGTIVGSPTFGSGKFGTCLTAVDISDNITLPPGTFNLGEIFTIDLWLKTTSTGTQIALSAPATGTTNLLWVGSVGGIFTVSVGGGDPLSSGIAINDGNWHHCVLNVTNAETVNTFVDGVAGTSFNSLYTIPSPTTGLIGALSFGDAWVGSIDEIALWNSTKYQNGYAVPTAAYVGTETNLIALYHLDGNATDSSTTPPPITGGGTIDPSNPSIVYSPFTWNVQAGSASTICSGAYLKTIFGGTSLSISFNTANNAAPFTEMWASVDYGPYQKLTLSAGNPTVVVATGLQNRKHSLDLIVKSTSETINRWGPTSQTMVTITAINLDAGCFAYAPSTAPFNVLIFGDSITEGVRIDGDTQANDTDRNDSVGCYAYALRTLLDIEIGVVGFGASGVNEGGSGSVPALPSAYNFLYSGVARSFSSPVPDLVIYNEGTNDGGSIVAGMESVVNGILALAPTSKHLLLGPFNQSHIADLEAVVAAVGNPNVTFQSTAGWFNNSESVDGTHPYDYESRGILAPKLAGVVASLLYASASGSGSGFSYATI